MMKEAYKIYVDTNVIINYCTGIRDDVSVLNYVFQKRRKELLFTSSLAIIQAISNLQTKKKTRKAFSKKETIDKLNKILDRFTVLDLRQKDVIDGFSCESEDIEDNTHYVLSQKKKCNAILTNNVSDFKCFDKIIKISPKTNLGVIKSIIN